MTDSVAVIYAGPDPGKVAPIASYWLYWAHRYRETAIIVVSPDASPLAERSDHWLKIEPGTEGDVLKAMAYLAHELSLTPDGIDTTWFHESRHRRYRRTIWRRPRGTGGLRENISLRPHQTPARRRSGTRWMPREDAAASASLVNSAHNFAVAFETVGKPGGGVLASEKRGQHARLGRRRLPSCTSSGPIGCKRRRRAITSIAGVVQIIESSEPSPNGSPRWTIYLRYRASASLDLRPQFDLAISMRSTYPHSRIIEEALRMTIFRPASAVTFEDGASQIWSRRFDEELLDALEELDFLVVEDCFPSELTALADVVLPAAMNLEVDGTFTNLDRQSNAHALSSALRR